MMFIRILLTLALLIALASCAVPPRADAPSIDIALDMLVEQDDSVALYRVATDGTIAFAGGYDARVRRFTWTGDLSHDEVETMRQILRLPFWTQARRDAGRPDDGEKRTIVTIHQPMRSRIIIRGVQPDEVRALDSLLREAASRRFQDELDALPRPGPLR